MKLWLLRPVEGLAKNNDPWEPWYDKAFGFVVRAETEEQARAVAMKEAGDEGHRWGAGFKKRMDVPAWTDAKYSTCVELLPDGPAGVVLRDFAAA